MTKYSERLKTQGNYEISFEPNSIWKYKKNKILEKLCETEYTKEQKTKRTGDWVKAGPGGHFSGWNKEYNKRIIEFWTAKGDTILDPFAGHSSSFMPYLMERNFIGFEITTKRYNIQVEHIAKLKNKYGFKSEIFLYNKSSEHITDNLIGKKVDAIITDPPFWDLEKYEAPISGTQLSDIKKLDDFNKKLKDILSLSVKYLKDGGYMIVKVANMRREGKLVKLKVMWEEMIEKMGMELVDEIILELSPVKRHPLYAQAITNLNMLKVHEYALVFRKKDKNVLISNHINFSRPLVKDVYNNEDRLFWSEERGKKDHITESLERTKESFDESEW